MAGHVIGKTLGRGYFGTVSRDIDAIIEPHINKETTKAIEYGVPVTLKTDGTGVMNWSSSLAATAFLGVAVREVKTESTYGKADSKYEAGEIVDVLTRGSCVVKCLKDTTATSSPVKGGAVYIRKASGDFVAAAEGDSGANTVKLTGVVWAQNGCDTDGAAEIVILDRKG